MPPWDKYASAGGAGASVVAAPAAAAPSGPAPWEKYAAPATAPGAAPAAAAAAAGKQNLADSILAGTSRAANSLLFGFGDELEGAIGAPMRVALDPRLIRSQKGNFAERLGGALGEGYREGVEQSRAEAAQFKKDRPLTATGLDVAGALTGGAGLVKAGGARLAGAFKAAPLRTAAGFGATEGALFGAGEAEGNVLERLDDSAIGAGIGALIGPAAAKGGQIVFDAATKIPGVVAAVRRGVQGLPLDEFQDKAMKRLMGLLKERGIDPKDALKQVTEAAIAETPGEMAFDALGEPGVNLAQGAVLRGTGPAQAGLKAVRARGENLITTASDVVKKAISGKNFHAAKGEIVEFRKELAKDAFAEARAVPIPPKFYREFLAPYVEANKTALRKALRIASAEGDQASAQQLRNALQDKATTLDSPAMARFMEGLSDVRSAAWRSGEKNLYAALRTGEDKFLEVLKTVNPQLIKARNMYAGNSRIVDAIDYGRDIFSKKLDVEDIADAFKNFTAGEKHAATVGVARAIKDKAVTAATDGNAISRFFRNTDQRERLRAVFPDDAGYQRFAAQLDSLMKQGKTNVRVDPAINSASAGRLAGAAAIRGEDVIDAGVDLATTGGGRTGIKIFQRIAKRLAPDDTKLQGEMAEILFEAPDAMRDRLIRFMANQRPPPTIAPAPTGAVTAAAVNLRE